MSAVQATHHAASLGSICGINPLRPIVPAVRYVDAQDLVRGDSTWLHGRMIVVEAVTLMLKQGRFPSLVQLTVTDAFFGNKSWLVLPWNHPFPLVRA